MNVRKNVYHTGCARGRSAGSCRWCPDGNHCRSEDDGHDAAHIQLQGQIAVLPAHLLAAHHALGVLDVDAALCVGHDDDEHNGHQSQDDQQRQEEVVLGLAGRCLGQQTRDRGVQRGPVGHDGSKDQQGNTVADALVIDLLAAPGDQLSTCHEGRDDDHSGKDAAAPSLYSRAFMLRITK